MEGQLLIRRSLTVLVYVNKQALLLAAAARTAEVSALKQAMKRSEDELSLTKGQLEESKGKKYPCLYS